MLVSKPLDIQTTDVNGREDLLAEISRKENEPHHPIGCPYITNTIESVDIDMLIDTGAEVMVLSNTYVEGLLAKNDKLPMFAITGLTISGVILKHNVKVRRQVMAKMTIEDREEDVTFLVIDGLYENGIMGNDFFECHCSKVNYEKQIWNLTFEGRNV